MMVPLCKDKKPMFFRCFRNTSSVLTRNLAMSRETVSNNPIESAMREKLNSDLKPDYLDVINESSMHNVPAGSETHFKIVIVSEKFGGATLVNRHRMVNEVLRDELKNGVHALSVVARTPEEWGCDKQVRPSPKCLGGKK